MSHAAWTFDTLQYAKRLKLSGFTDEQAEGQAEALKDLIDEKLATKQDLVHLEKRLTNKMSEVDGRLTNKMAEMDIRLTSKINEMGYKLTIRLGGMIIAGIAVLGAFKFFS